MNPFLEQYREINEIRQVQISSFWHEFPELWFAQLEAQFSVGKIRSEEVKFSIVMKHLDNKAIKLVRDIIKEPPLQNQYQKIKTALLTRCGCSEEQQLRKLLTGIELGSKKNQRNYS